MDPTSFLNNPAIADFARVISLILAIYATYCVYKYDLTPETRNSGVVILAGLVGYVFSIITLLLGPDDKNYSAVLITHFGMWVLFIGLIRFLKDYNKRCKEIDNELKMLRSLQNKA